MTGVESAAIEHDLNSEASYRLLKEKQLRRKQLLVNLQPAVSEFVCRIHWPAGFQIQSLPATTRIQIADGFLDVHYEVLPAGVLAATCKRSTGTIALNAAEIAYIIPSYCAVTSREDLPKTLDFCRKSAELDPSNETARMTLLSLLRIYVNLGTADPEMTRETAELMLPISAEINEKAHLFIAQCLFPGEDYEKLITFIDQMPENRFAAGFKVAAVSVKHGSQKGIAVLNTVPQADRDLALTIAIEHLSAGRHYKLVFDFMDDIDFQKGKSRTEFVAATETVKTLRRYERVVLSDASVDAILQQVYLNAAAGRDLRGRSDNLIHEARERRRVIEGSIHTTLIAIDALEKGSLLVPEGVADSVSLLKYAIEGNHANGYRVGLVLNERKLNVYPAPVDAN